jgi:hypothetical protein
MPLAPNDRKFLQVVERLKVYILVMAVAVFIFLLVVPETEIQMSTSIVGIALCGVFWLTQRLLSFITLLDLELTPRRRRLKRILRSTSAAVPPRQPRPLPTPSRVPEHPRLDDRPGCSGASAKGVAMAARGEPTVARPPGRRGSTRLVFAAIRSAR